MAKRVLNTDTQEEQLAPTPVTESIDQPEVKPEAPVSAGTPSKQINPAPVAETPPKPEPKPEPAKVEKTTTPSGLSSGAKIRRNFHW